jgi:hypothetical protein
VQALAAEAASMATSKPRPHPRDSLVEFIRNDPLGDLSGAARAIAGVLDAPTAQTVRDSSNSGEREERVGWVCFALPTSKTE